MPASAIEPPDTRNLEVNGVRLSYAVHRPQATAGTEDHASPATPPVVLLHGWPETSHAWHRVVPALTARGLRRSSRPTCAALGDSERPRTGYDVRNVAEDIHQLVANLVTSESTSSVMTWVRG